jgi:peptidoglycan/xylan/chitin deacetylase (PgdA/CDA1 family)
MAYTLFEEQVRYLSRKFRILPLSEIVAARKLTNRPIGDNVVSITIDDGYLDFLEFAYPILQKYQAPATVFLVSEFVSNVQWLWFDALHYLLAQARDGTYEIALTKNKCTLSLADSTTRIDAWNLLADDCLGLPAGSKNAFIGRLAAKLDLSLPKTPTEDYAAMTWDQIRQMDRNLIEFGSHTCTHPILSTCSDEELVYEIRESRRRISQELQRDVSTFCYPNGMPADFDSRAVSTIESAGYNCAVVAYGGLVSGNESLLRLPRLSPSGNFLEFKAQLSGIEHFRSLLSRSIRPPQSYRN